MSIKNGAAFWGFFWLFWGGLWGPSRDLLAVSGGLLGTPGVLGERLGDIFGTKCPKNKHRCTQKPKRPPDGHQKSAKRHVMRPHRPLKLNKKTSQKENDEHLKFDDILERNARF